MCIPTIIISQLINTQDGEEFRKEMNSFLLSPRTICFKQLTVGDYRYTAQAIQTTVDLAKEQDSVLMIWAVMSSNSVTHMRYGLLKLLSPHSTDQDIFWKMEKWREWTEHIQSAMTKCACSQQSPYGLGMIGARDNSNSALTSFNDAIYASADQVRLHVPDQSGSITIRKHHLVAMYQSALITKGNKIVQHLVDNLKAKADEAKKTAAEATNAADEAKKKVAEATKAADEAKKKAAEATNAAEADLAKKTAAEATNAADEAVAAANMTAEAVKVAEHALNQANRLLLNEMTIEFSASNQDFIIDYLNGSIGVLDTFGAGKKQPIGPISASIDTSESIEEENRKRIIAELDKLKITMPSLLQNADLNILQSIIPIFPQYILLTSLTK